MKFTSFKSQKGFSLVELMIVVGIIGILATLALPRFKQFQAKAKMGEAKNILSHIYTLEQTYSLDNNQYVGFTNMGANPASLTQNQACGNGQIPAGAQAIGFRLDPCLPNAPVPRYGYSVQNVSASTFTGVAVTGNQQFNRVCPGNGAHFYGITQDNVVFGAAGAPQNTGTTEPNVGTVCAL